MNKLPSVTISGQVLSDLFFNSKLENWNNDTTTENLTIDAFEFCDELCLDIPMLPNLLVVDFLKRL